MPLDARKKPNTPVPSLVPSRRDCRVKTPQRHTLPNKLRDRTLIRSAYTPTHAAVLPMGEKAVKNSLRIFSTFSGIGGFELGIEKACADQGLPPPNFVGYSEIDKFAISVYEKHFKGVKNYGDIKHIKAKELPDFDCLVGGFPCQAFSAAGKRGGFDDPRGTLFFEVLRLLQEKRPAIVVLENVKGLLSHGDGRTFKTIIASLAELGYRVQWKVLNSQSSGVPQKRERVIIVGHLGGAGGSEVFPIVSPANKAGKIDRTEPRRRSEQANSDVGIRIPDGGKKDYVIAQTGDSVNLAYLGCKNKRGRVGRGFAHTLTASLMSQYTPVLDADSKLTLRRFTPKECERLQGFPDDWTKYGSNGKTISDTQRYRMCGNAVTVGVIRAVFKGILS